MMDAPKKTGIHYGWIVIFTGLLTTIGAHGFGRMAYTLILPAMKDGLTLNYTQLGLLGTANFIGYLLMALVGGILAARFGTRIIIFSALVVMGVTLVVTGRAESFETAFAMRLLTGLGNGAAFVPAMALSAAWFGVRRRGLAAGIVSGGIGGGTMIAGLIVPPILGAYGPEGWRYAWYYLGAGVLLISIVSGLLLRNRPSDLGLSPVGQAEGEGEGAQVVQKAGVLDWGGVYRNPDVWRLGIIYFMYGFSYIIYMTFFAAYLVKELGLEQNQTGALWAFVGGLSIFCGVIWGSVSDHLGRGKGAALAYLTLASAFILFALSSHPAAYIVSSVLFGLAAWSIPTIMAAAAGDLVGPRLAPAGLGFVTIFFGLGQALGPGVGGYIADKAGVFFPAFALAAAVALVGSILSFTLLKK